VTSQLPLLLLAMLFAQATETTEVQGPVLLKTQRDLGRHITAFPRVQSNEAVPPAIAAKINASLQRLDETVSAADLACRKQFRENLHRRSVDGWERSISVTMKGPSFLSLTANDSTYCGGPHPDSAQFPMVYDLSTGRPVGWLKLLPPQAKESTDSGADGTPLGLVIWEPLQKLALAQASPECAHVFDPDAPPQFALSLDGRTGMLVASPYGLPHVIAACADDIEIDAEQARRLGVSRRITDALNAARALQH
jgi:hypothetical protein